MSIGARPSVARRTVAGSRREFSEISFSLDPPASAPPSLDSRSVALLHRAREHGVTTFDVSGARFPERAERLLARAFPTSDPSVCAIVSRSVRSLARERSNVAGSSMPDLNTALRDSLEGSRRRLAPVPIGVIEWLAGDETATAGPSESSLTYDLGKEAAPAIWATELPRAGNLSTDAAGGSPGLVTGALSLLETELIPAFESAGAGRRSGLIAYDPFAGGRLDGSRFAEQSLLPGPATGPVDVRRLHEEFDPVLRLGFLTEGRRRTLGQAALQFVLAWSWVVTTVVPLPSPERFDELLDYTTRPPLTGEELERIGLVK